jgi:hypothetical protein
MLLRRLRHLPVSDLCNAGTLVLTFCFNLPPTIKNCGPSHMDASKGESTEVVLYFRRPLVTPGGGFDVTFEGVDAFDLEVPSVRKDERPDCSRACSTSPADSSAICLRSRSRCSITACRVTASSIVASMLPRYTARLSYPPLGRRFDLGRRDEPT